MEQRRMVTINGDAAQKELSQKETIEELQSIASQAKRRRDGALVAHDVDISPALARGIIRHLNSRNPRNIRPKKVQEYATEMRLGNWKTNLDPLAFREDLSLMNAQHRCAAAATAGTGMQGMVVIFNAPDDAALAFDHGVMRNIRETHNVQSHQASSCQVVLSLESGGNSSRIWTRGQVAERYGESMEIFDHYSHAFSQRPVLRESHMAGAFVYAECMRETRHQALRDLCEDMTMGTQEIHAARVMANHVVNRKRSGVRVHSQTERITEAKAFLNVIQGYLLGDNVGVSVGQQFDREWWVKGATRLEEVK